MFNTRAEKLTNSQLNLPMFTSVFQAIFSVSCGEMLEDFRIRYDFDVKQSNFLSGFVLMGDG